MKLEIICTGGKWVVNGKQLNELNLQEREFMNAFFREVKLGTLSLETIEYGNA